MNFLVVLSAFIALTNSAPAADQHVTVLQDTAGNYKVDFNIDGIAKVEENKDGHVNGEYSYVDGDGKVQKVVYTAGLEGFVVQSGTNLPVATSETEEVAKARQEHATIYSEVLKQLPITEEFDQSLKERSIPVLRSAPVVKYIKIQVPVYADDTPEVVEAKLQHRTAYARALAGLAA